MARERDLCDVKIKIVEYFPSSEAASGQDEGAVTERNGGESSGFADHAAQQMRNKAQPFGVLAPSLTLPPGHPGEGGRKYYTIQRVNGAGKPDGEGNENGDGDAGGNAGGHRHSLEESDRIKKNSVLRGLLKEEKEGKRKKVEVREFSHHVLLRWRPRVLKSILVALLTIACLDHAQTLTSNRASSSYLHA